MIESLLKIKDLQKQFQFSRQGIHKMINENRFPKPMKIGRSLRWKPQAIEDFLAQKEKEI